MLNRSQRNFAHVTTVLLSWRLQNFVVIGWSDFEPQHYKISLNLEFEWNIVSGMGAWYQWIESSLIWAMACRQTGNKPWPEPVMNIVNQMRRNKFQ